LRVDLNFQFSGRRPWHNDMAQRHAVGAILSPLYNPIPIRCPKCKISNDPAAKRCDCGYDFRMGRVAGRELLYNQKRGEFDGELAAKRI